MSKLLVFFAILLVNSANSIPLEQKNEKQTPFISIVDIPAEESPSKTLVEDPVQTELKNTEETKVPVEPSANSGSVEDKETEVIKPETPTILIIRRPLFPFLSNPFNNERPLFSFPRRPIFSSLGDSSEEDKMTDDTENKKDDDDFYDSLFKDIHSHMTSLFNSVRRRPVFSNKDNDSESSANGSTEIIQRPQRPNFMRPIFPSFNFPAFPSFSRPSFNFPDLFKGANETDLKNSTTSETKIVDGHVVTVNKTTNAFRDKDNKTNGWFQFQVINVRPTTEEGTKEPAKPTQAAPVEPSSVSVDYDESKNKPSVDYEESNNKKVIIESEVPNPSSNEVIDSPKDAKNDKVSGIDDGLLE